MSKFLLTRDHVFNSSAGPILVRAGETVDSSQWIYFRITANATVIEDESSITSHQMLADECRRNRSTIKSYSGDGNDIPGFGSATALPE